MFFRPDLEWTLQPMNSSSRKRLSRRRREVTGHVEDQAKSPTGLGYEATPHGWRSAQSTSARRRRAGLCSRFPGFPSAGWAYPYVSWLFNPRDGFSEHSGGTNGMLAVSVALEVLTAN